MILTFSNLISGTPPILTYIAKNLSLHIKSIMMIKEDAHSQLFVPQKTIKNESIL